MNQQWVSTHQASTEHDLSVGLRENFSARKTWQSAFAKVRAAGRLNAAAVMARQRRDSVNSLQSGASGRSGGWKTIAGEDSDPEDTPSEEKVPSPQGEITSSPTSSNTSPAEEAKGTAQAVRPKADSPTLQGSAAPSGDTTTSTRSYPLPAINIVSPATPVPRPVPKHSSSMPGSFNGSDILHEDEEDKAAKKDAEPSPTTSSPRESPLNELWDMASRMKKLVIG